MNILCATDINFAPYCGIMLTSLLENNCREATNDVNVYVLVDKSFTPTEKNKYKKLCTRYGAQLYLITVDNQLLPPLPIYDIHQHPITIPTYY